MGSAAQVIADYNAMPWYQRAGVAADDMARILAHSVTGGLVDTLQGPDEVARTQDARTRAGLAGDVANVGGMVLGLKGAAALGKGLVGAVKAAPTAASLIPTAGLGTAARYLTGTAGPGLVPAAEGFTKMQLAKAAVLPALFGLSVADRADPTVAKQAAAVPAAAPAAAAPTEGWWGNISNAPITTRERQDAFVNSLFKGPLSLGEAGLATGMMQKPLTKPYGPKDYAASTALTRSQEIFQTELAAAQKLAQTDPAAGAAAQVKALQGDYDRHAGIVANPANTSLAEILNPGGQ